MRGEALNPLQAEKMATEVSSRVLVSRAREGDREAFEELYLRYHPMVTRRLVHLCGPGAPVADMAQDVFASAYRSLARFRGEAPVHHWLMRIATNRARTHHRRRATRFWLLWDRPEREDQVPCPLETVDLAYPHLAAVHQALGRLSPRLREAVALFELEGLSLAEMASELGISINTAASRVRRGRNKLKRILQSMGYEPEADTGAAPSLCRGETT